MSDISKDTVEMLANNLADFYKMEAEAEALRAQQARIEELEARLSDSTDSLVTVTKKLAKAEAQLAKVQALVSALAPYAALAKHHAADAPEWGPFDSVTAQVSIRNLRDATAALEQSNPTRKETP